MDEKWYAECKGWHWIYHFLKKYHFFKTKCIKKIKIININYNEHFNIAIEFNNKKINDINTSQLLS